MQQIYDTLAGMILDNEKAMVELQSERYALPWGKTHAALRLVAPSIVPSCVGVEWNALFDAVSKAIPAVTTKRGQDATAKTQIEKELTELKAALVTAQTTIETLKILPQGIPRLQSWEELRSFPLDKRAETAHT